VYIDITAIEEPTQYRKGQRPIEPHNVQGVSQLITQSLRSSDDGLRQYGLSSTTMYNDAITASLVYVQLLAQCDEVSPIPAVIVSLY
jgi:hypothetical protein